MSLEFICTPNQADIARKLLSEASNFGAEVSNLEIKIGEVPRRSSLLEPDIIGLIDLRWVARAKVLSASGAADDDIGISSQLRKIKEEAFHRGDYFSFVVWKDHFDRIVAQGEMRYMTGSEVYKKLMALAPTNRGWEKVACWDLGNPEFYLDENSKHFQRVHLKSQTFLFSDELEGLRTEGSVVTYSHADLYEEGFEAYLVDVNEYKWPTLYKARGYLLD